MYFDNDLIMFLVMVLVAIAYFVKKSSDKFYRDLEKEMRKEHEQKMMEALPRILEGFRKQSQKENQVSREYKRVVVCAACKYGDVVFCGARHYDGVMVKQILAHPEGSPIRTFSRSSVVQGFIDNRGQFLTREEALVVATEAGQIKFKHDPKNKLFSEDLY